MKKVLLITVALCMCRIAFSQETESVKAPSSNEIKLNLLMAVALYPEITYERNFAHDFGFGLSAAVSLDGGYEEIYQLTPFFRFYFSSKPSCGFFIETNMALVGRKVEYYDYDPYYIPYNSKKKSVADFGLGFAVGYKYFNSRHLVGETYLGLGRTFDSNVYPRIGIVLGVRL